MRAVLAIGLAASLAAACRSTPTSGEASVSVPQAGPEGGVAAQDVELMSPGEVDAVGEDREGWLVILKPYLLAAGMRGVVGAEGSGGDVEADFAELLSALDIGGMLGIEVAAPGARLHWLVDLIYVGLEESGKSPAAGVDKVDAEIDQLVAELTAAWELQPEGQVDLLVGLRYWSLEGDLNATLTPPNGSVSAGGSESWLDPLIGLRSRLPLAKNLDILLRLDFAGFGMGSEYSYNLGAVLGWSVSQNLELALGYRHLYASYDDNDFVYDVDTAGPVFGLAWTL